MGVRVCYARVTVSATGARPREYRGAQAVFASSLRFGRQDDATRIFPESRPMSTAVREQSPLLHVFHLANCVLGTWLAIVFVAHYCVCLSDNTGLLQLRLVRFVIYGVSGVTFSHFAMLVLLLGFSCVIGASRYESARGVGLFACGSVYILSAFGATRLMLGWSCKMASWYHYEGRDVIGGHPVLLFVVALLTFLLLVAVFSHRSRLGAPTATQKMVKWISRRAAINRALVAAFVCDKMRFGRRHTCKSLVRLGRFEHQYSPRAAIKTYTAALAMNCSSAEAYHMRGHAYMELKLYDCSVSDLRRSSELSSGDFRVITCFGWALESMGHLEDAEAQYRRAVDLDSNYTRARWFLADLLLDSGNMGLACQEYDEVLRRDPTNASAHRGRFRCAVWDRDTEKARDHMKSAVKHGWVFDENDIRDSARILGAWLI